MIYRIMPEGKAAGCLPRRTRLGQLFPRLADKIDLIPESQWKDRAAEVSLKPYVPIVHDQDGVGSCASNAATACLEIVRQAAGLPFVHLSPASLYKQVNGGVDAGSSIDDNLQAISRNGVLPVSLWGDEISWRKSFPQDWKAEAAKYRLTEWYDIGTWDEFVTAVLLGFPVCYGVWWGGGGHAICAVSVVYENSQPAIRFLNSWGTDWGDAGFGTMSQKQVATGISYFGAWAARVPVYSGG